jgi:hypothetical protein
LLIAAFAASAQSLRAGALSGLAAVREVIGAVIALNVNGSIRTLTFSEAGVSVRRGAPLFDSFPGAWRHDARSNKICFDFHGREASACERVSLSGSTFSVISDDGRTLSGPVAFANAKRPGQPTRLPPAIEEKLEAQNQCGTLRKIVEAARSGSFQALHDTSIDVRDDPEFPLPSQFDGGALGACSIDRAMTRHVCRPGASESTNAKPSIERQTRIVQGCFGGKFERGVLTIDKKISVRVSATAQQESNVGVEIAP